MEEKTHVIHSMLKGQHTIQRFLKSFSARFLKKKKKEMHLPLRLSYSKYVVMWQNCVDDVCALTLTARQSWNGDLLRGVLDSKNESEMQDL